MIERLTNEQIEDYYALRYMPDALELLANEVQQWRALIPEVIEQLEAIYLRMGDGCLGGAKGSDLDAIIAELREQVQT